jgi:tetratricopeptide (TPR) repeat protein
MVGMTPQEILALAREGDLAALGAKRDAVADAVRNLAEAGDAAAALELIGRAWRIWMVRGEVREGSALTAVALGAPGASSVTPWRARTLYADGLFAFRAGEMDRSRARNEEALQIARASGDLPGECEALTGLARVALREGRYTDVVSLGLQGRELARAAADPEAEAPPLHLQAVGVRMQRRYAEARDLYLESLDLNRRLGNVASIAMEQHNLGWVEIHLGNVDQAEERFHQRDPAAGPNAYLEAWSHLNAAAVAAARHDWDGAQVQFDRGTRAIESLGVALDPDDKFELDWLKARLAERC